jgi:RimJ/RimL family protein N-acetyltransferase
MLNVPQSFHGRMLEFHLLQPESVSAWAPWFAAAADDLQLAGFLVGVADPQLVINQLLSDLSETTLTYVAHRGDARRPAGFFQLHDLDLWSGTCEYSAFVAAPCRRSVLAAAVGLQGIDLALVGLGFRKLHAHVASGNLDARQPLVRLGFTHEATLHEHVRRSDGSLTDVDVLSMMADRWTVVRRRVARVLRPIEVAA